MKSISIIGGGPSALLLASFLDESKYKVTVYEKNKTVGRKFLVAGDGGFNLTHAESIEEMVMRYTPYRFLKNALLEFSNTDLINWLNEIGIPTFIGSSKRVYPNKDIKPIEVLNAILKVLEDKGVAIKCNKTWDGWTADNALSFEDDTRAKSDYVVFALGGGSWKVTGSDGAWLELLGESGTKVKAFEPSNCAYQVNWDEKFMNKFGGSPLKNIAISCGGKSQKGEVVITKFGLEGNAIYALSPEIRADLNKNKSSDIYIDLKPSLSIEAIQRKIEKSKLTKLTDVLKVDLKLSPVQLGLVKKFVSKDDFTDIKKLSSQLKNLKIELVGFEQLDKAISTVGGVSLNAVNENFELKTITNYFCIGEMLNWDAPTGGYLLQGCFSMGVSLARFLNSKK